MTPMQLQRGQRLKLSGITPQKQFIVGLKLGSSALTIDISCFGLDKDGRLSDDRYFVFYNQKLAPREAIKMLGKQGDDQECFWVDLASLPASIQRLVFVISIDGVGDMKALGDSYLRFLVGGASSNRWQEGARFSFSGREFTKEKALMVAEVYMKDEWRLASIGQGFAGGLDAVLKHFGGEMAEESPKPAPITTPQPVATPQPVRTTPAPPRHAPTPPTPTRVAPRPTPLAPTPPARQPDGKHCTRCGEPISFWEKTTGRYNATTGRCASCERIIAEQTRASQAAQQAAYRAALNEIHHNFASISASGSLTNSGWKQLEERAQTLGIPGSQLREIIAPNAISFLQNLIQTSAADGIITPQEDADWERALRLLALPGNVINPLREQWMREKTLSAIRQGNLPTVNSNMHLDAGEIVHYVASAQYHKVNRSTSTWVHVNLTATNKKLYVVEPGAGGKEILYSRFLQILPNRTSITLELSTRSGAGTYQMHDVALFDAVLTTLVRMSKRHLVKETAESRHIPQAVKTAVWQRDAGKCVQCGDSNYLEFDHEIPYSKGGASSVNNVQLLCRRCNLAKGDRL